MLITLLITFRAVFIFVHNSVFFIFILYRKNRQSICNFLYRTNVLLSVKKFCYIILPPLYNFNSLKCRQYPTMYSIYSSTPISHSEIPFRNFPISLIKHPKHLKHPKIKALYIPELHLKYT